MKRILLITLLIISCNVYAQNECFKDAVPIIKNYYNKGEIANAKKFLGQIEQLCEGAPTKEFKAIKEELYNPEKIKAKQEDKVWALASNKLKNVPIQNYLKAYPNGRYKKQALSRLKNIKDSVFVFNNTTGFYNGKALVCVEKFFSKKDTYLVLDEQGNLTPVDADKLEELDFIPKKQENNIISFRKRGKCGYKNKNNKVLIKPKYDECGCVSDKLIAVKKEGKWGYINFKGNTVIPFMYKEVRCFSEGLAAVSINGANVIFINKSNKIVLSNTPFIFDWSYKVFGGMDMFSDREYCLFPEVFNQDTFEKFADGVFIGVTKVNNPEKSSSITSLMNKEGKIINKSNYFAGGKYKIVTQSERVNGSVYKYKYGFIDKQGNYLIIKNISKYNGF